MRVFEFSLGRVLDLRKQVEKEKARTVAEARRRSEEAESARENLAQVQRAGRARLAEAHKTGGSIGQLRNMEFVLERMEGHLRQAEEDCREADRSLVESVKHYTQAFKDRSTLDRLRSRRLEEWRTEESRRDQKDMDEIAVTRHGRMASESSGA
jgi:flagellar FliJ protein